MYDEYIKKKKKKKKKNIYIYIYIYIYICIYIWPVVGLKHDTPKVNHLRMFESYAD